MFVKTEYRMEKVKFNDIHYVEGMKDYLRIVCPDKRIMTLTNFKNMLDMLPEEAFCRIHKSYIINLSKIQSIEKSHVVILNERLPIGDSFRKSFFELLEKLTDKKIKLNVIILTAYDDSTNRELAQKYGVKAFFRKPAAGHPQHH